MVQVKYYSIVLTKDVKVKRYKYATHNIVGLMLHNA